MYSSNRVRIREITLDPGGETTLERRPSTVKYYFAVSGRCTLYTGEKSEHSFIIDDVRKVPNRVWHCLKNTGKEKATVVEVMYE